MLSLIIPCYNDYYNLNKTLESLYNSSEDIECIVIDDCSNDKISINGKFLDKIKLIKNEKNIGPAQCRCKAIEYCSNEYIMTVDSHTLFLNNWSDIVKEKLLNNKKDNVLYFPMILSNNWDIDLTKKYNICYGGQFFKYNEKNKNDFWGTYVSYNKNKNNYIKLASYIINKEFLKKIRYISDIKKWGADELCLTIKVLLSGGTIELLENPKLAHIESRTIFKRDIEYIYYNKLRMAKTFLPNEQYNEFINNIPKDNNFINNAIKLINQDKQEINEYKQYYSLLFSNDFSKKFINV